MADLSGRVLGGRYKIEERLGEGGMGQVWRGYDLNLKRRVAVKFIKEDPSSWSKKALDRFKEEALILARLEHSRILTVYDFGTENDGPESLIYLVMRLAVGGSLIDRLQQSGPLSFDESEHIFTQICQAVIYAHQKRVIHFDLKPSNILFDEAGDVLVADFGLAKILEDTTHVKASTRVGTWGYMAPEQIWGYDAGPESDVYALGIILYQMLTGEIPEQKFDNDRLVVDLEDFLPARIKSVIGMATKASRKERLASAYELMWEVKEAIPRNIDEAFIKEFDSRYNSPQALAFSPNGRFLAMSLVEGDQEGTSPEPAMCVLDINSEQIRRDLSDNDTDSSTFDGVHSPSFSYDAQILAAQTGRHIYLWDVNNGEKILRLAVSGLNDIAFSPVSNLLVYGCADGTMLLWDWANNQPAQQLEEQAMAVSSIAFSPDGTLLTSAYKDGSVRLWNIDYRQEVKRLANIHADKVVFSPNMRFLAAISGGGWDNDKFVMSLWDIESGQRVWQINGEANFPVKIAFSPNNQMLALGTGIGDDGYIELWDIKNQYQVWRELRRGNVWYNVAFNRQGCLALVNSYGHVELYRP
ncbi:MAG: hypothetical protein BroJett011_69980 [Chloroflexota bacterium]|nr:MAG: hypothetical protein BroJett011_69980 [Chloroflexota bacterium]